MRSRAASTSWPTSCSLSKSGSTSWSPASPRSKQGRALPGARILGGVELKQRRVLEHVGVRSLSRAWHNLVPAELYEHAARRGEALIVATGALDAETGQHTGRSPKDKFFVKEPTT